MLITSFRQQNAQTYAASAQKPVFGGAHRKPAESWLPWLNSSSTKSDGSTIVVEPHKVNFADRGANIFFTTRLNKVHFRQSRSERCYLLAAWGSVLRHPDGPTLLASIDVGWDSATSEFLFSGPKHRGTSIRIGADEISQRKNGIKPVDGPEGIKYLELYGMKLLRSDRNRLRFQEGKTFFSNEGIGNTGLLARMGNSAEVLGKIFEGEPEYFSAADDAPEGYAINWDQPIAANPFGLINLFSELQRVEKNKADISILTAYTPPERKKNDEPIELIRSNGQKLTFDREHEFSIFDFNTATERIIVSDPLNTERRTYELTFDEFCQVFRGIEAYKIPRASLNVQPRQRISTRV